MDFKISREDRRKEKELDEARKAGTVPAELDEEGKFDSVSFSDVTDISILRDNRFILR